MKSEITGAIEAMLFAAGEPLNLKDLKKIFSRLWAEKGEAARDENLAVLEEAFDELKAKWQSDNGRGFGLVEVADGLTFRSNPRYAEALRAMQEQRPARLSRAALETLSIVAYRQPATKPEIDHIRGVDCGGTIRLLLDRGLIRIMGKKEEPGRPLLYGTSKEFLSFFNLSNLTQLPTLEEFQELSENSQQQLEQLDLSDLRQQSTRFDAQGEPATDELDGALKGLRSTAKRTREALAAEGIHIEPTPEAVPDEPGLSEAEGADNPIPEPGDDEPPAG